MILVHHIRSAIYRTLVIVDRKGVKGGAYKIRYKATWFRLEVDYATHIIERHKYLIPKSRIQQAIDILEAKYDWFILTPIGTFVRLPKDGNTIPIKMVRISEPIL